MFYVKHDPGPCPVDDCPHHTCVPGDDAASSAVPSSVLLPARDGVRTPRSRVTIGGPAPGALTTATWTRAAVRAAMEKAGTP